MFMHPVAAVQIPNPDTLAASTYVVWGPPLHPRATVTAPVVDLRRVDDRNGRLRL